MLLLVVAAMLVYTLSAGLFDSFSKLYLFLNFEHIAVNLNILKNLFDRNKNFLNK